jgi:hypothetical protein
MADPNEYWEPGGVINKGFDRYADPTGELDPPVRHYITPGTPRMSRFSEWKDAFSKAWDAEHAALDKLGLNAWDRRRAAANIDKRRRREEKAGHSRFITPEHGGSVFDKGDREYTQRVITELGMERRNMGKDPLWEPPPPPLLTEMESYKEGLQERRKKPLTSSVLDPEGIDREIRSKKFSDLDFLRKVQGTPFELEGHKEKLEAAELMAKGRREDYEGRQKTQEEKWKGLEDRGIYPGLGKGGFIDALKQGFKHRKPSTIFWGEGKGAGFDPYKHLTPEQLEELTPRQLEELDWGRVPNQREPTRSEKHAHLMQLLNQGGVRSIYDHREPDETYGGPF